MANLIPLAIADLELQLASSIAVGGESFTLNSAVDDDGEALPAGKYCFTVDSGTSNKEYLIGQLNGTAVTSVKSVSRQGVETTGAVRAHRVGNPCIVTNFATLQRVADILRGELTLDGSAPIIYDAEPTLADRKEMATVGYVLDTVTGGTVAFDTQTTAGNAGEAVSAGDLVYFKTSDQEWYLADAAVAAEVENVAMGFALGSGTDGVAISGGIQISGTFTTTGLTAGSTYYATDTAGTIGTTAGTTNRVVGVALSTTKLLMVPINPETLTSDKKDALAAGGDFGTPSATNKFLTEDYFGVASVDIQEFTADGTWTKPGYGQIALVEVYGAGGGGANGERNGNPDKASGGGGGAKHEKWIKLSDLSATEAVVVGAGGTAGVVGGASNFAELVYAYGGGRGSTTNFGPGGGGISGSGGNGSASIVTGGAPAYNGSPLNTAFGISDNHGFGGGGNNGNPGNAIWGGGAGGRITFAGGSSINGGGGGGGGGDENQAGSAGGQSGSFTNGGGAAGGAADTNGTSGTALGEGGGGGGGASGGAANAGDGGNGGIAAGGGGGGGVDTDAGTGAAGSGGTGGDGFVRVTVF